MSLRRFCCSLGLACALATSTALGFGGGSDSLENATVIDKYGTSPATDLSLFGDAGEPAINHPANAGKTAWWKWTATETGFCSTYAKRVKGGPAKALVAVFKGASAAGLQFYGARAWDDGNAAAYGGVARVTFWAVKGQTYHIALDLPEEEPVLNGKLTLGLVKMKTMTRKTVLGSDTYLGEFSIRMQASGAFTASLKYDGRSYPLAGKLDEAATYTRTFPHKSWPGEEALPDLQLGFHASADEWSVDLTTGGNALSSGITRELTVYGALNPQPLTGRYTATLTGSGKGVLLAGVNRSGQISGVAILPDRNRITFSTALLRAEADGEYNYECYMPKHHRGGLLAAGWISHGMGDTLSGTVLYQLADMTRHGFDTAGGRYTPPRKPTKAEIGDGSLTHMGFLPNSTPDLDGFTGPGVIRVDGLGLSNAGEVSYNLQGQLKILSTSYRAAIRVQAATGLVTGEVDQLFELPGGVDGRRRRNLIGCLSSYAGNPVLQGHVLPYAPADGSWSPGDFEVARRLR